MERDMQRRVASGERQWGRSDLSHLSDAELDAALADVEQRLMANHAVALDRFSLTEKADQAEAAFRRLVAQGEAAARLITGRTAPRTAADREG